MKLPRTPRLAAAHMSMAMSAALVFAACGGGEGPVDAGARVESTTIETSTPVTAAVTTETTAAPTTTAPATEAPTTAPTPTPTTGTAASPSQIPDVAVINVSTGDSVSLRSVAETGAPVALWFWFPH